MTARAKQAPGTANVAWRGTTYFAEITSMSEIEKSGMPTFITGNGRFVAIITSLSSGQVESQILAEVAREIGRRERA